ANPKLDLFDRFGHQKTRRDPVAGRGRAKRQFLGICVLKVIERGESRDDAFEWRMLGYVGHALATGVHSSPVAKTLDELCAAADTHFLAGNVLINVSRR